MKRKRTFLDILDWIVLGLVTLWLILKVTGVINTPLWLQYGPLFGVVYWAGRSMKKLDSVSDDVVVMKSDLHNLEGDMISVKKDISHMKEDIHKLENVFQNLKPHA